MAKKDYVVSFYNNVTGKLAYTGVLSRAVNRLRAENGFAAGGKALLMLIRSGAVVCGYRAEIVGET